MGFADEIVQAANEPVDIEYSASKISDPTIKRKMKKGEGILLERPVDMLSDFDLTTTIFGQVEIKIREDYIAVLDSSQFGVEQVDMFSFDQWEVELIEYIIERDLGGYEGTNILDTCIRSDGLALTVDSAIDLVEPAATRVTGVTDSDSQTTVLYQKDSLFNDSASKVELKRSALKTYRIAEKLICPNCKSLNLKCIQSTLTKYYCDACCVYLLQDSSRPPESFLVSEPEPLQKSELQTRVLEILQQIKTVSKRIDTDIEPSVDIQKNSQRLLAGERDPNGAFFLYFPEDYPHPIFYSGDTLKIGSASQSICQFCTSESSVSIPVALPDPNTGISRTAVPCCQDCYDRFEEAPLELAKDAEMTDHLATLIL